MRNLVLNRLLVFKHDVYGFGPASKDPDIWWKGYEYQGVPYSELDLDSLSDPELLMIFENVVAKFENMIDQRW